MMMNFVLPTRSLQHLAGVKIVTHLWNHRDVIEWLEAWEVNDLIAENLVWRDAKDMVERKVSALQIPEQCKKELINLIKPLGKEIITWCIYHDEEPRSGLNYHVIDLLLPNQLYWTMHGTVDYQKTAEIMVKDKKLDIRRRFELACIYCLQVEARELFKKLARNRTRKSVAVVRYANSSDLSQLILLFARTINLDVDQPKLLSGEESSIQSLFEETLRWSNRTMREFLFQMLKPGEKDQIFDECRMRINSCRQFPTSNLLWYLSLMKKEQQRRMFGECTAVLLECLLYWPTQSLFMEAAKCGWQFMNDRDCSQVLSAIVKLIIEGCNDYDYCELFNECLSLGPADYQQFNLHHFGVLSRPNLWIPKRGEFFRLIVMEAPVPLIEALCDRYRLYRVVVDDSVISDAALLECREATALNSANNQHDLELRLRRAIVRRLVDCVMEYRIEVRELGVL